MRRHWPSYLLGVLSLTSFVVAVVLVHASGHQTMNGSVTDPDDPGAASVSAKVKVECSSPASGTGLNEYGYPSRKTPDQGDVVVEDDASRLQENGLDAATVSDVCGRLRSARLSHAGELGFLGLLLGGSAFLVSRRPDVSSMPRPSRTHGSGAVI